MAITKHEDHSSLTLFKRTISAQIHMLGLAIAFIGFIFLLVRVLPKGGSANFWACLVFGLTSMMVFASSSIYHFLSDGYKISSALDLLLENLDHFSIYLFIAGTYTPVLLNTLSPNWSVILISAVWVIATLGVLYTYFKPRLPLWARHRFLSTGLFLAMGWLVVFRIGELIKNLAPHSLYLLVAGGLCYSVGAVIYATKRPRLFVNIFGYHELWHIMVLLGYGFHYFVVLSFYY